MTVERVIDAWVIKGPVPAYHDKIKNKLRREWPTLAKALDELTEEEGRS